MTNKKNRKVIALFDFDGTITTSDSLGAFLLYNFGILRCGLVVIIYLPVHLLYKLNLLSSTAAKNFLLPLFLRNIPYAEFTKMGDTFCKNKLPGMIKAKAIERIQWHQQKNHEVIIVSASVYEWIRPWATSFGITKIITSKLEIVDGRLTGKLAGKNCNHEEKVVRIVKEIPDIEEYEVYAYGNSKSDRFMLSMADKTFYKKFEENDER